MRIWEDASVTEHVRTFLTRVKNTKYKGFFRKIEALNFGHSGFFFSSIVPTLVIAVGQLA